MEKYLKEIVLCADDFGQDPHISQGILALISKNRLSATSCMTTEEDWKRHGPALLQYQTRVDIGLHFNLTHGTDQDFCSVNTWLKRAFLGQINKNLVEKKLHEQLDQFEQVLGRAPDFIDGHQHIHSFPSIRECLITVIKERFPKRKPYVRTLSPSLHAGDSSLKALILKGASWGFSQALEQVNIHHNIQFGGIYSLTPHAPYRDFMKRWLQQASSKTLLMCHPGHKALHAPYDPIHDARVQEYTYFSSEAFLEDCEEAKVALKRF